MRVWPNAYGALLRFGGVFGRSGMSAASLTRLDGHESEKGGVRVTLQSTLPPAHIPSVPTRLVLSESMSEGQKPSLP